MKLMKFYTNNPISIVSAVTAYKNKLNEIIFIEPNLLSRGLEQSILQKRKYQYRRKIAKIISDGFDLKFTILSWQQFYNIEDEMIAIDSHLLRGQDYNSKNVLFAASDTYSGFRFSSYTSNIFTKLKLEFYWQKQLKLDKSSVLYIFGYKNKKLNKRNVNIINKKELEVNLKLASESLFKSTKYKFKIDKKKQYVIVLPPVTKYTGEDFSQEFLKFVHKYSANKELSIILKVHPNDSLEYYSKFGFLKDSLKVSKYYPVEFLFTLPNIRKIIAVPSASLVYANQNNLSVLVPKNRELFRTNFLDQLVFLETNKISLKRI
jgi:hypothetical protein